MLRVQKRCYQLQKTLEKINSKKQGEEIPNEYEPIIQKKKNQRVTETFTMAEQTRNSTNRRFAPKEMERITIRKALGNKFTLYLQR